MDNLLGAMLELIGMGGHNPAPAMNEQAQHNQQITRQRSGVTAAKRHSQNLPTRAKVVQSTTDGRGSQGRIQTNARNEFSQINHDLGTAMQPKRGSIHNNYMSDYANKAMNDQGVQSWNAVNKAQLDPSSLKAPGFFDKAMMPYSLWTGVDQGAAIDPTNNFGKDDLASVMTGLLPLAGKGIKVAKAGRAAKKAEAVPKAWAEIPNNIYQGPFS